MATDEWTAEGGTNGTTISAVNSGGSSGTALSVSIGASTTLTYTTAEHMHGSVAGSVTKTSGTAQVYAQRSVSGSPNRHVSRLYIKFSAFPAGNTGVLRHLNTSNGNIASLYVDSTGKLVLQNTAGTAMFTATTALSTGTWYRVELATAPGTTSSTGAYDFAYYAGDSTTAIQTSSNTGQNLGVVNTVGFARIGRFDTGSTVGGYFFDDFGNDSLPTGLIGPYGVAAPTAGTVTTDNIYVHNAIAGSTAAIGGALTFGVTHTSGETLTYTEPFDGLFLFVKSAVGSAQYTLTVSETGGGSANALINIPQLVTGTITSYTPRFWFGTAGVPSQDWT